MRHLCDKLRSRPNHVAVDELLLELTQPALQRCAERLEHRLELPIATRRMRILCLLEPLCKPCDLRLHPVLSSIAVRGVRLARERFQPTLERSAPLLERLAHRVHLLERPQRVSTDLRCRGSGSCRFLDSGEASFCMRHLCEKLRSRPAHVAVDESDTELLLELAQPALQRCAERLEHRLELPIAMR